MPPAMRNPVEREKRPMPPLAKDAVKSNGTKLPIKVSYLDPIMDEAYRATVVILGYEPDFPKNWKD